MRATCSSPLEWLAGLEELLSLRPDEAAARLGIRVTWDEGPSVFGGTALYSAWEPGARVIRLFRNGIEQLAARRECAREAIETEAVAHELLHALGETHGLALAEDEVRAWAAEWAARGEAALRPHWREEDASTGTWGKPPRPGHESTSRVSLLFRAIGSRVSSRP